MRIVICDYAGHPFPVELSRALAQRGHRTLHVFAELQTPLGQLRRLPEDSPNFAIESIPLRRPLEKRRIVRRWRQEVEIGAAAARLATAFDPDVVVGCNMPLDAQRLLYRSTARTGTAFVYWIQDVLSEAIGHYLRAKLGPVGAGAGRYYAHLEGKLLRSSDAVVAICDKFRDPLAAWGVDAKRIRIIPNWAPLGEIYPVPKDNAWSRHHGLDRGCLALYTGTLGLKQEPPLLLELAKALAPSGLRIAVVSEGAGVDWLSEQHQPNLVLLPFQPIERYPEVLGAGDIMLATLGAEAATFSVPSKILSYLAAGKPVVASIAPDNDAARTIAAAEAGFVSAPDDRSGFIANVARLSGAPALRERLGKNGRAYAERRFDIARIADAFEDVIGRLKRRRRSVTPRADESFAPGLDASADTRNRA